jgi:hypothetical protein
MLVPLRAGVRLPSSALPIICAQEHNNYSRASCLWPTRPEAGFARPLMCNRQPRGTSDVPREAQRSRGLQPPVIGLLGCSRGQPSARSKSMLADAPAPNRAASGRPPGKIAPTRSKTRLPSLGGASAAWRAHSKSAFGLVSVVSAIKFRNYPAPHLISLNSRFPRGRQCRAQI